MSLLDLSFMRTQAVTLCPPLCLYHGGAQNTCSNNETNRGSRSTQDAAVWGKRPPGLIQFIRMPRQSTVKTGLSPLAPYWRIDILQAPATDLPFTLYTFHLGKDFHSPGLLLSVWMTPNCSLILFSFPSYRFSLLVSIRYFHSMTTPQHKTQLNTSSRQKLLLLRCCLK